MNHSVSVAYLQSCLCPGGGDLLLFAAQSPPTAVGRSRCIMRRFLISGLISHAARLYRPAPGLMARTHPGDGWRLRHHDPAPSWTSLPRHAPTGR